MSRLLLAICVTIMLVATASAQTASDLERQYAHHEVYELQPGVQMTAKFASNGFVCEMQIEQTHFVEDGVDLRYGIDEERVNSLIDKLVPPSNRGKEDTADPANGMVTGWGQGMDSVRSYSNVRITISSSHGTTVLVVKWRHRTCQA